MVCYKDMTFCSAECENNKCERRLTPKIVEGAIKWWGSDKAPIATCNFSDDCNEYQPISIASYNRSYF
jgi:hypothetical protein